MFKEVFGDDAMSRFEGHQGFSIRRERLKMINVPVEL